VWLFQIAASLTKYSVFAMPVEKILWVQRGALPEWYDIAVEANQGKNPAINELKMRKIHASETAWVGTEFDHIIDNNSTIDALYKQTKLVISNEIALPPRRISLSEQLRTVGTDCF